MDKDEIQKNKSDIYRLNEYKKKIEYKFQKEPQNLKFKLNITKKNTNIWWNDIFEIFISIKDNKEYLVSPNNNNYNLDIFTLLDNKKILSFKGHNKYIRTIRYFLNKKNYFDEYLISGDDNHIVIIWEISNNKNIKYQIVTKYMDDIYSCLLIFPHNNDENYIITSTYFDNKGFGSEERATKVFSLSSGKFIKYIINSEDIPIYYLLLWYNKKNDKYYIIQLSYEIVIINNLLEDDIYSEFKQEKEESYFSGFIYNKDDNEYLCFSSSKGFINVYDLYNKKILKIIDIKKCKLAHIIQWNEKYIIVADFNNNSFKIIDFEQDKIISDIGGQHKGYVTSIKKINHPVYGESLLSAGCDKTIKLWSI